VLEDLKCQVKEVSCYLKRQAVVSSLGVTAKAHEASLIVSIPGLRFSKRTAASDMVISTLHGRILSGEPSRPQYLAAHATLYRSSASVGAIIHCASEHAAAWAASGFPLSGCKRTGYKEIASTRRLSAQELAGNNGEALATAIMDRMGYANLNYAPGILVGGFGTFAWGDDVWKAAEHVLMIEDMARMTAGPRQRSR
jgi:Ribulose-5-phosphate 4-epimerase and related epimerases and aldolases